MQITAWLETIVQNTVLLFITVKNTVQLYITKEWSCRYTSKGYSRTLLYRIHPAADANVTDTNDPIQDMPSKLQFHKSILQVTATA